MDERCLYDIVMTDVTDDVRNTMPSRSHVAIVACKERIINELIIFILPVQTVQLIIREVHLVIFVRFCRRLNNTIGRAIIGDLEEVKILNLI